MIICKYNFLVGLLFVLYRNKKNALKYSTKGIEMPKVFIVEILWVLDSGAGEGNTDFYINY